LLDLGPRGPGTPALSGELTILVEYRNVEQSISAQLFYDLAERFGAGRFTGDVCRLAQAQSDPVKEGIRLAAQDRVRRVLHTGEGGPNRRKQRSTHEQGSQHQAPASEQGYGSGSRHRFSVADISKHWATRLPTRSSGDARERPGAGAAAFAEGLRVLQNAPIYFGNAATGFRQFLPTLAAMSGWSAVCSCFESTAFKLPVDSRKEKIMRLRNFASVLAIVLGIGVFGSSASAREYGYRHGYYGHVRPTVRVAPTRVVPRYRSSYVVPQYRTGYVTPQYRTGYVTPQYSTDYVAPQYSTDYVAPQYSTGYVYEQNWANPANDYYWAPDSWNTVAVRPSYRWAERRRAWRPAYRVAPRWHHRHVVGY
jgi:hypothetical protein